uniref:Uncharacterized protein n=1 Tax=viral metagenome TaxID=1070528 RepID=A0A6M3IJD0_9ZZZZ
MKFTSEKKKPKEVLITIDKFHKGSNKLVEDARMSPEYAVESVNQMQVQDGLWKTKWGSQYYGATHSDTIDGAAEFVKSDASTELITITDGVVYKSTDGGDLTQVTGATFTADLQCYFMQIAGYLYIANGTDPLTRYDGSTLSRYTELAAPANLAGSLVASGLSSGSYKYYAEVTALNSVGETVGSTEASITCNKERDVWVAATDKGIYWGWDAVATATRYQLYISTESGDQELLANITAGTTSFIDDGSLDINPYIIPPLSNTTAAPKFKSMCISNNRIWATNDEDSLYTVYFSGTGQFIGNFSDFYGGGWINLEKGGRELPIAVKHYQSGSGAGRATVLCRTPDGKGAVWQLEISTATVGDTSFSIPSATKVVGSFGTESLNGVVATNNDIAFPNRKGWFTLGPEKNYYGILRTNERSSIIRNYWRSLVTSSIDDIAAYYYDAKIFIAVPTGTSGNDRIIIYDTERTNWAVDWTNAVKQFLEYTDTAGNSHFLYIPITGEKLIELSENFINDLGTAFNQSYISPLIPVSKKKSDILSLREAVVELGRPRGVAKFQLLGIGKNSSFTTLATKTISSFASNTGVGADLATAVGASSTRTSNSGGADSWAVYLLDSPSTFTQSSVRAAIKKRAKIYSLQFKVFSTTADTDYTILGLQAKGNLISSKIPSSWID